MKVYQQIARNFDAMLNCKRSGNDEWYNIHLNSIVRLCKNQLPSGSGFDCGTTFNFGQSRPDRLVFDFMFHHMDDNGMYNGWTDHRVIVKPSLAFDITFNITGRDRNGFKEYAYEVFSQSFFDEVK